MKEITLRLPLKKEYLLSVRLFLSGLLTSRNMNVEQMEDFKVAISEACLILMCEGFTGTELTVEMERDISVKVEGLQRQADFQRGDTAMSFQLISELVDEVSYGTDEKGLCMLTLKKVL